MRAGSLVGKTNVLGTPTRNRLGTEHPQTGWNIGVQAAGKSMRGKDGRLSFGAHNPKVGGSNPPPRSIRLVVSAGSPESDSYFGREVLEGMDSPGTHRGHNKVFLAAPSTPSSASASLQFVTVTFSHPAFTAVTRVQIPSGTPNIPKDLSSIFGRPIM